MMEIIFILFVLGVPLVLGFLTARAISNKGLRFISALVVPLAAYSLLMDFSEDFIVWFGEGFCSNSILVCPPSSDGWGGFFFAWLGFMVVFFATVILWLLNDRN